MYMSGMDFVLEVSADFHDDDRAGQVWPRLLAVDHTLRCPFVVVPGADSIDCSGDVLAYLLMLYRGSSSVHCLQSRLTSEIVHLYMEVYQ